MKKPGAIYENFLDFAVTAHIDVSDVVGETATCTVKKGLPEYMGVEDEQLLRDALENSTKIRPAVTTPIGSYVFGDPIELAELSGPLMIASVNDFMYGAGVVLYPGFMNRISGGKNLFLLPSSIHEWLYLEDIGDFTVEQLTEWLRTANREVVIEEEILSYDLYYYDARVGEIRRV